MKRKRDKKHIRTCNNRIFSEIMLFCTAKFCWRTTCRQLAFQARKGACSQVPPRGKLGDWQIHCWMSSTGWAIIASKFRQRDVVDNTHV